MRYHIYLTIAFSALFLAAPLIAQEETATAPKNVGDEADTAPESVVPGADEESEQPDEPDEPVEPEEEPIDLDNPEDADLDEQSYEAEDDDFVPTQEIPADTPIPFPSNI